MTQALTTVGSAVRAVEESNVNPGLLGFVVVALLGVATWLLIRSMNRQIRKIDLPDDPPDEPTRDALRAGLSRPRPWRATWRSQSPSPGRSSPDRKVGMRSAGIGTARWKPWPTL